MVTEMITLKLENKFLKEIDTVVDEQGYQSRTEFIRNALHEKLDANKLKKTMLEVAKFKGIVKKKTTAKEYEEMRRKAFDELSKKFK
ncbi:MAG: ribbon-helix-helix domain-containing protein [Nanoarchaeota archaeon]